MPVAATTAATDVRQTMLDCVDFKWLMAGEGHHIDIGRLHQDHAYARGCLSLAAGSRSAILRAAAERLRGQLPPLR